MLDLPHTMFSVFFNFVIWQEIIEKFTRIDLYFYFLSEMVFGKCDV